ncbi:MAG: isoleucine--tRNA ligase [Bacilli bacterium]
MSKIFKELEKGNAFNIEQKILKVWKEEDLLQKTIDNRKNSENFVFYDGPATANGMPGVHHMLAKFLKDAFCKYQTMNGKRVIRKIGWDTHGLPVEVQVEKEMGFTGKKDIEKFGIEKFNQKCREAVWVNEESFGRLTDNMGQFIDQKNSYITYKNDYIETEWWILKKFFDEGLFYEGYKVLPFCCRCGTGLASHEVAQNYKEISANTVIVPMKMKSEDCYFLVWTTTPWTLIANVALCVNPNEKYVKVLSKGFKFIIASALANKVLGDDYEIINEYDGKDLEYVEYEQLIPSLKIDKKGFFVTCDTYVTMEDGTGIVHIAPAFGADDSSVAKKYNLPYLNPVGEDGCYTEGLWKGMKVFDADLEVIKYLKENDKLFKKQKMLHNYPHCWRCDTPLLYYSKPSYYLEVTKLKEKIIENNKTVNWYPDYVGEKRFGNWLESLNDWAISRQRYWGTPLPLWTCSCGHTHMIGSKKELIEKAIEKIDDNVELHRPYVDDIHIKCDKCGKTMNRVKDVIDCWFDSGSMPFAQYHYPFENKKIFDEQFPADFIAEGIDQTRGWFYSLLVIATFVKGVSPYKNVLVNDLLLDKNGQKMHKSRGNAIDPFKLMESYGADTIRWYLPYVSPVWTPIKFDEEGLKEVYSKFFNTFKNTYGFFALYANTDNVDPKKFEASYEKREEIDRWLLSKYNSLLIYVTKAYSEYDLTKVVRSITDFVNDDLSNWYIRRNRRRFWASNLDNSKKSVYKTTYEVLEGICKMIAPIASFTAEEVYQALTAEESVHLCDFPKANDTLLDDALEKKMDLVRTIISLGRNAREEVKIKVRQPVMEILIDSKNKKIIGDLETLIKEELNVKNITYIDELTTYMNYEVKPNFKVAGPVFGSKIKLYQESLKSLSNETILLIESGNKVKIKVDDVNYEIDNTMVDIRINAKEGYNVTNGNSTFIILNTTLNEALIDEGVTRELISKVQNLRKEKNFDVADRIKLYYDADDNFDRIVLSFEKMIKSETLSIVIVKNNNLDNVYDLNNIKVKLDIEKA